MTPWRLPQKSAAACWLRLAVICSILFCSLTQNSFAASAPKFVIGWSVYAGWNPFFYMAKSGILRRWADKYGIQIEVQRFDYAASLDAFVAKNIDACTMTNMEALDMPAASGVDSTAIILGDYSDGNDAVLTRSGLKLNQLSGKHVMLVQKTVSEYLLERALVLNGLQDEASRLKLVNTSDSDIAGAFLGNHSNQVVVTWKPLVSQILDQDKGVANIFDSSKIPGEIMDLLMVRTEVLHRQDGSGVKFAKAVTGAWYEAMAQMSGTGPGHERALNESAAASGDTPASYSEQLKTTHLFYTPKAATDFNDSAAFKQKMDLVRQFCFHHNLLGEGTQSVDDVAILYPDGSIQGKKDRVRFRFDSSYMHLAGQGKL
ncbi:NitT/TauT family transport system substrate-binding protein [Silvibacterium bohemicum]|uniref:NitT/TauT family transport system substrate-binding protein n=1 Tax=Silvibacterium bohemicum TaxID=1577686 RepID=A0A841JQF2_9BACT|nr:putative urea ABC transporter substrate-binding protein [Silvibacterium bohemicum]MBB6143380.1 NitT/TauT family transport system substrate-binding protein [Silvibacterium bohemicum]